ncbi:class I SAM-dependent methyltransferase [Patescibacteria group bacterium]|nr:class I SAM-dependent methyltransferase [Patescibacteria group bacterium]MBU1896060.1 class I SAM-dependent methyltransferase [Patescibacteria group bacterium]
MEKKSNTLGWGKMVQGDAEIWDTNPIFTGDRPTKKDWFKLLFYPKKWFLYRYIKKDFDFSMQDRNISEPYQILDIGCGTGASVIDLKKMFGRRADVVGIDVVKLQIDIAREKIKKNAITADVRWYDGKQFPFSDNSFDAIYTSDVLGHVEDVPFWLSEINRVLKKGGILSMFSESALGHHAYVRKYLFRHGLNIDPHAEFHISLYSKHELRKLVSNAGMNIEKMIGAFWVAFIVHPEEFYPKLQEQKKFFFLRMINKILTLFKKITRPVSIAMAELYGLIEMYLVGPLVEAQSYVILARKK